MRIAFFVLLLSIGVQLLGCNSISSTMLNRMDTDDFVGNSNGEFKKHCKARPYKGMPITLRVPTHVDVAIKEKVRFSKTEEDVARVRTGKRHLFVETDLVYTDQVFMVDIKRPAAGTAHYEMTMGEGENAQYFAQLDTRIVDQTIQDITAAIDTVMGAVAETATNPEDDSKPPTEFFALDRTVAWKRFDVDAVDFEHAVAAFVEEHMNGCHNCTGYQASDGKSAPQIFYEQMNADVPTAESSLPANPF